MEFINTSNDPIYCVLSRSDVLPGGHSWNINLLNDFFKAIKKESVYFKVHFNKDELKHLENLIRESKKMDSFDGSKLPGYKDPFGSERVRKDIEAKKVVKASIPEDIPGGDEFKKKHDSVEVEKPADDANARISALTSGTSIEDLLRSNEITDRKLESKEAEVKKSSIDKKDEKENKPKKTRKSRSSKKDK